MIGILKTLTATSEWLRASDRGATAVEYGMIVALIAAVIVVIVGTLGGQVDAAFTTVSNALPGGGP